MHTMRKFFAQGVKKWCFSGVKNIRVEEERRPAERDGGAEARERSRRDYPGFESLKDSCCPPSLPIILFLQGTRV